MPNPRDEPPAEVLGLSCADKTCVRDDFLAALGGKVKIPVTPPAARGGRVHDRPRPSSRAQIRQGNNTRGSALLRRKNRPSYSPSHFSSVTKPVPFFRPLTSVTIGAASLPNV